jgi:hypothetical protein
MVTRGKTATPTERCGCIMIVKGLFAESVAGRTIHFPGMQGGS